MSTCARAGRIGIALALLVCVARSQVSRAPEPAAPAARPGVRAADLVLEHGRIVTVEAARPEAQALAAIDGRVAALGTDEEIAAFVGPSTQVVDLSGKLAIPGFIEGHGHFVGLGRFRTEIDLTGAKSWDDVVALVAQASERAASGEWIVGRGWHQEKWTRAPSPSIDGMPTNAALGPAAPHHPVVLQHASGHACIANAEALAMAGIDRTTPDPKGGTIQKDASGNPTGVLLETAEGLVELVREAALTDPVRKRELPVRWLERGSDECLSKGITSFQDAGSPLDTVDLMNELARMHKLRLRLWVMLGDGNETLHGKLQSYRMIDAGGGFLTVRAIKRDMDGALCSHGAWMLAPYADVPATSGTNVSSIESITEAAKMALADGYQLCVHAIGDRANRETLDVFERVLGPDAAAKNRRWRIEHAQHIDPADVPRFAKLGVVASMQGVHCTSDGPWVIARLGAKRAEAGAYVWQKLLHTGAVVSNGTDTPVEDVNPIACYYASVSRKLPDGTRFFPDQRMSREEALRSYTWAPAYAAFEEKDKGTLAVGKLADVTVLSKDILRVPEDEIPSAKVVYTIVGGKIAYAAR